MVRPNEVTCGDMCGVRLFRYGDFVILSFGENVDARR